MSLLMVLALVRQSVLHYLIHVIHILSDFFIIDTSIMRVVVKS